MSMQFRRRALLTFLASLSLVAVPDAWAGSTTGVAVVAHRGASESAPENTLSAVAQAVADRSDLVEFDVRLTKDGFPVVLHDRGLVRTTNVRSVFPGRSPWLVKDFTLAEVRALDAGLSTSAAYAGERVPTLGEVLHQLSLSPSGAIIEVKDPRAYGGIDGIGAKVYEALRSQWPAALTGAGAGHVVVASVDEGFVRAFGERHPDIEVSVIAASWPGDSVSTFADNLQVAQDAITPERAADARAAGLTLGAWTVDDPGTVTRLADEVDSITTGDPVRVRRTLAADGRLFSGTSWPARQSLPPSWRVTTRGRQLNSRVAVRASLVRADGTPARWQRAAVQRWVRGAWRTVLRRATDAAGRFSTSLTGSRGLTIRVVTLDDLQFPIAASSVRHVALSKVGTTLRLGAPRSVGAGVPATLTVRWRTSDDRPISGDAQLFRRRPGGRWRYVRDLLVSEGYVATQVRPRRTMEYRIRGRAGWWFTAAADDRRVGVS